MGIPFNKMLKKSYTLKMSTKFPLTTERMGIIEI